MVEVIRQYVWILVLSVSVLRNVAVLRSAAIPPAVACRRLHVLPILIVVLAVAVVASAVRLTHPSAQKMQIVVHRIVILVVRELQSVRQQEVEHQLQVVLSLRKLVVLTWSVVTRTAVSLAVSEQAGVARRHQGSVSPTENVVRGSVKMATAADKRETDADKTRSAAAKTATKTKADVKPNNHNQLALPYRVPVLLTLSVATVFATVVGVWVGQVGAARLCDRRVHLTGSVVVVNARMGDAAKKMERDADKTTFAAVGTATAPQAYVKLNNLVALILRALVVWMRSVATTTAASLAVSEQAGVAPKHWGSVSPTENVVRGSVRMATAADERETDADKTRSAAAKTATKTKADVKPKNQNQLALSHKVPVILTSSVATIFASVVAALVKQVVAATVCDPRV
eukprot:GHVS01037098.1.p2 GENE.GHVS01037098.1~~GHVS01037098.1.p2  ORF type:complete len:400 (+),score=66.41 GHVS01037098.1:559-1758(+)